MSYTRKFEDEGFVYELTVNPVIKKTETGARVNEGYNCTWTIIAKSNHIAHRLMVTDDDCEVIIYNTVEAAVTGARDFLVV